MIRMVRPIVALAAGCGREPRCDRAGQPGCPCHRLGPCAALSMEHWRHAQADIDDAKDELVSHMHITRNTIEGGLSRYVSPSFKDLMWR